MKNLNKHKAQHKAAMSRKKVQSNPLEEIMRPVQPEPQCNPVDAKEEGPVHYGSNGSAECGIVNPAVLSKDHRKVTCPNCRGYLPIVDAAYQAERKRPQNSPAVQDERMRRKGRFPDGTQILPAPFNATTDTWTVDAVVPSQDAVLGSSHFTASGPGIHGCIESLWDQYCRWRDEQEAASTEGTLANWTTVELVGLAADPKNWSASAPEIKLNVLK